MSRGRGRGRGRGRPFGNMEGIGIGPGDAAPPPILQPPPLFPVLERKPLEMKIDDNSEYLYSVKQELQLFMKQSPFYIKADSDKPSIERYSDKYKEEKNGGLELVWTPEWNYFPAELQPKKRKKEKKSGSSSLNRAKKSKKRKLNEVVGQDNESADGQTSKKKKVTFNESGLEEDVQEGAKEDIITKKLSELEKSEASEEEVSAEEELDSEEHYDEEIEEEGTDYNLTYFDNGEEDVEDDLEENEGPYY